MKSAICALTLVVLVAGCTKPADKEKTGAAAKDKPQSTTGQAIDYMTGKTAVKAGQKARATLEGVSARKKDDLDQVLD